MACGIRGDSNLKGVKLPGEVDIDSLETKLCMFADDTQIINKDEDSLTQLNDVLSTYETVSGSKINFDKTKGLYIGSARNRRPTSTTIQWVTGNVKTMGIHHGYGIQDYNIWKSIIEKIKSCIHIWKSRNLTYGVKLLYLK